MSTTVFWKFGSTSDGLATKSAPFSTDDGANSLLAVTGIGCKTVKSPTIRKPTMALHTPVRSGALMHSDVAEGNKDIFLSVASDGTFRKGYDLRQRVST